MKNKYAHISVPPKHRRRTHDEITIENQLVCREWYGRAREELAAGNLKEALYWQSSAAHHWPKVAYRMGIAQILWP